MIQEEKETAELRAEELESRVAIDTLPANWRPEIVYDRSSPPLSGRSTPSPRPSLQSHDYIHKYHTLNSAVSQLVRASLFPGTQFTDDVLRFIMRYILQQKLRCPEIILGRVVSEFTEIVFHDLKYLS